MSQAATDIVELVRVIVEPLVEDKDSLRLESVVADDGVETVEIRVAPEDAGKVIGRQGRVIKSIRVLARAATASDGREVEVELIED